MSDLGDVAVTAADRKRQKAQELLQLAEDTMSTATTPGSPATKLESAVKPSNVLFNNQQQVTEGLLRGPLAEKGSSTGELSQALVAAQKLLTGMHPSNVPGLSFTKVVSQETLVMSSLMTLLSLLCWYHCNLAAVHMARGHRGQAVSDEQSPVDLPCLPEAAAVFLCSM